jgi:hypothetical protein
LTISADDEEVDSAASTKKEAASMRSLNGNFETYQISPDPRFDRRSVWDRLPLRPLLAISAATALLVGATVYLHKTFPKVAQPQTSIAPAVPAGRTHTPAAGTEAPVVPPTLRHDAVRHAQYIEQLMKRALTDLQVANASLEKVRPYARSEVDVADQKVQQAQRDLNAARGQLKLVKALITSR